VLILRSSMLRRRVSYAKMRLVAGLRILIWPSIGAKISRSVRLIALKTGASVR